MPSQYVIHIQWLVQWPKHSLYQVKPPNIRAFFKCTKWNAQCPVEALGYLFLMESWGNSTFWVLVHLRGDVFAAGVTKPLPLLHLHLCWWFPELPPLLLTQGLLTHVIRRVIQSALYTGQFYISSLCTMILLFCQGLLALRQIHY